MNDCKTRKAARAISANLQAQLAELREALEYCKLAMEQEAMLTAIAKAQAVLTSTAQAAAKHDAEVRRRGRP